MEIKKLDKAEEVKAYDPSKEDAILLKFVEKRVQEMKDYRKGLGIEELWNEN